MRAEPDARSAPAAARGASASRPASPRFAVALARLRAKRPVPADELAAAPVLARPSPPALGPPPPEPAHRSRVQLPAEARPPVAAGAVLRCRLGATDGLVDVRAELAAAGIVLGVDAAPRLAVEAVALAGAVRARVEARGLRVASIRLGTAPRRARSGEGRPDVRE